MKSMLMLVLALATSGCVHYVPVKLSAVPPQEQVRVRLDDDAAVRMVQSFGAIEPELFGTVEPVGSDSMSVSVWTGKDYRGTAFENVHTEVVLGNDEVVGIERRRISVARSAVVATGVVAGFAALVYGLKQIIDPNPGGSDTPPPPPPSGNLGVLLRGLLGAVR